MNIELIQGDITKLDVDAIVNAANSSLLGGGGVDGAIHRAGGKAILDDCRAIRNRQGKCATGQAVITTAGKLPAQKVIHTVGPVWQDGKHQESNLLTDCYLNSIKLAEQNGLTSIAFPNISTGVYKFPKKLAAQTAIKAIQSIDNTSIKNLIFVCFDLDNYLIYKQLLEMESYNGCFLKLLHKP